MSSEKESEEIKNLVLRLLKTMEELKFTIPPLIKGQDYALKALEAHTDALEDLMGTLVAVKKDQEIVHQELGELKDYSVDHRELYQELESRVRRLEIISISKIVEKVKSDEKVTESELQELELVVKRKPEEPSLWLTFGIVYLVKGQIEESLECFNRVIQIDNKDIHAWCLRGLSLQGLGKHKEALESFETSRKLTKCPIILRHEAYSMAVLGKKEQALDLVNLAIQGDKEDALSWALKGRILSEMDRDMEALGCLEKALELYPNLFVALSDKGIILLGLGPEYYEEALNCFNRTVQLNPNSYLSWRNKGRALQWLHRNEEAIKSFDRAIELEPKDSCLYCFRGVSKNHIGNNLGALEDFDKALEIGLTKDCGLFYVCRAIVLDALERYEEALKDVEKGFMTESYILELLLVKASILIKLERTDETKKSIESAIQLHPTDAYSLDAIAYTLYELGEFSRALKFANKAVEKEPNVAEYLDTLACVLYKLGQDENALRSFEKALELRESDTDITWSALAELYKKMGKSEEAEKILKRYLE